MIYTPWSSMKCPNCGKRAFDISALPQEKTAIEIKCPNCHKLVTVLCTSEHTFDNSKPTQ